ncbi:hypothetical protein [Streptomyces sp. NPDC023588]|uniref:hypothetical protein n=1 Tax=Streptomyces sp. NPDC023588 TaxID=3154907 RepID=UPI0033F97EA9
MPERPYPTQGPEEEGGLTVLAAVFVWGWLRRRHRRSVPPCHRALHRHRSASTLCSAHGPPTASRSTCPAAGRPAGTVVAGGGGPAGTKQFELTDALLPDGTYAAEPLALYP